MKADDLQAEINRRIQAAETGRRDQLYALSTAIQQLIIQAPLPESLSSGDRRRTTASGGIGARPRPYAVRSSALGEDWRRPQLCRAIPFDPQCRQGKPDRRLQRGRGQQIRPAGR
jgi:phosphoenolpyruvate synthase/pyruvate phosphate dikinase